MRVYGSVRVTGARERERERERGNTTGWILNEDSAPGRWYEQDTSGRDAPFVFKERE